MRQAHLDPQVQHELDCQVDARPHYGVCGSVSGYDSTVVDNGGRELIDTTHFDHTPSDAFIRDEVDVLLGPVPDELSPDDTGEMMAIS